MEGALCLRQQRRHPLTKMPPVHCRPLATFRLQGLEESTGVRKSGKEGDCRALDWEALEVGQRSGKGTDDPWSPGSHIWCLPTPLFSALLHTLMLTGLRAWEPEWKTQLLTQPPPTSCQSRAGDRQTPHTFLYIPLPTSRTKGSQVVIFLAPTPL